jgi:crotonobetainyl-CoA:carnitine CoA-transferase CaiB-like acyl-CoA transferase
VRRRALVVGAGNDRQFALLCAAIGRPELAADARFGTKALRVANRAELDAALHATFATAPAAAWRDRLQAAGVPCAPVQTLDQVFTDPQVVGSALVQEAQGPEGPLRLVSSPLRVDGVRPPVRRPPPRLGEHTDGVLTALGLDAGTRAEMRARGAC